MNLQYKEINIRQEGLDDAELLLDWYNDGSIMEYAGFPDGKKTSVIIIRHYINHDTKNHRHIIEFNDKPIGEIIYRDLQDKTTEISILIADKDYQNKGYGKIILSLFIDVLFFDLGFDKVKLETYANNKISQHVFEELDFKKVKEYKDNRTDTKGNPMSTIDYELVAEDFNSFIK